VRSIISESTAAGATESDLGAKFGRLGYSSAVVPASVNSARAQRSVR
jgi:hypothetical protein